MSLCCWTAVWSIPCVFPFRGIVYTRAWSQWVPASNSSGQLFPGGAEARQPGAGMLWGKMFLRGGQGDNSPIQSAGESGPKLTIFICFLVRIFTFYPLCSGKLLADIHRYWWTERFQILLWEPILNNLFSLWCPAVDLCLSYPCKNGATCTRHLNTYTCKCAAGFHGSKCDKGRNIGGRDHSCWSFLMWKMSHFCPFAVRSTSTRCRHRNGGCEHFCRMNPDRSRVCFCAPGYGLDQDNSTCLPQGLSSQTVSEPQGFFPVFKNWKTSNL